MVTYNLLAYFVIAESLVLQIKINAQNRCEDISGKVEMPKVWTFLRKGTKGTQSRFSHRKTKHNYEPSNAEQISVEKASEQIVEERSVSLIDCNLTE